MQSKTSCFNGTIFKKNMAHFWPLWALYTLVLIAMLPFSMLMGTMYRSGLTAAELKEQQYCDYLMSLENSMHAGVIFVAAVICAMAVFYYMYTPRSANMMHAFPVSRTELYVTNYFSGLLFLFLPQIFTFFITIFVCLAKGIKHPEYLLVWLLMVMGMSFFAYSMAVMIGMMTGQLFTMPIFFFIANYLYMAIRFMIVALESQLNFGISENIVADSGKSSVLSPMYWMIKNAKITCVYKEDSGYLANITGEKEVAVYAVIGIIFATIGLFIYKRRDLETVGDFITRKWLKPVFRWGSTILFSGVAAAGTAWVRKSSFRKENLPVVLIMAAVCAVLVFFISQMVLEKKFKVFSKKKFGECAATILVMFVIIIGTHQDVFGIEKKVPKAEEVKSVFVYMDFPMEETKQEEIEEIIAIHKSILNSKEKLQKECQDGKISSLTLRYCYKDGTTLERNYEIPFTKEYYNEENSALHWAVKKEMEYENCMKYYFGANYKTASPTRVSVNLYNTTTKEYEDINIGSEHVEDFYKALQKDIKEGNLKEVSYLRDEKKTYDTSVTIDYYNPQGIVDMTNKFFEEEYYPGEEWKSSSTYVEINTDCKHILEVLDKSKIIDKTHKLLTYEEKKQLQ